MNEQTPKMMRLIATRFATICSETKKKINYGDICLYDIAKKCVYHCSSSTYLMFELEHDIF